MFPYLGWIVLGWLFTWAAVELNMFQRLLLTTSLSGGQWGVVIGLSWLAPAVVAVDKAVQGRRLDRQAQVSAPAAGVGG